MEEKELTDEEIVKALECCVKHKADCPSCPKWLECYANNDYHIDQTLDLIRRLQYGYSSAHKASEEWKVKFEALRKENDEQKAEIERLNELKEEKTCRNISEMHPVDGFTCSECGISIEDYSEKEVDEESGDITYREYMLRYCPNCGAKVVNE